MGLFRPSRTKRAGRWFEWKVRIFLAGAALGLVGIFLNDHRVIVAALAVLAVGVVLRAISSREAEEERWTVEGDDGGDDPADEPAPPEENAERSRP